MPDAPVTFHQLGIDWNHDTRPEWEAKHARFAGLMDLALIEAHVRILDLDSLDEPDPDEPPVCPHCDGRGWTMTPDYRRPWRELKTECWECQ